MALLRHRLQQWYNRIAIHRLGLPQSDSTDEPGLILVQIDGLSRSQLERALDRGRMPFLKQLIDKQGYLLHTMYSGLPSTTPAVQGELFYGVRGVVPAFSFRDPVTGLTIRMVDQEPAAKVEDELAATHEGLLAKGSAYTNIYSGGAAEPHFCAATMGWNGMFDQATITTWMLLVLWNWLSIVRVIALMFIELGIGIYDVMLGLLHGQNLKSELGLVPSRVAVGVGLRELATIGASMDASRGLKIVQLNYLGYDEQAHRRGPAARFAHWSLRGIDKSIKRLVRAANTSDRRPYHVWVYSDHGQERVHTYESQFGRPLYEAVVEAFGLTAKDQPDPLKGESVRGRSSRARWLRRARPQPTDEQTPSQAAGDSTRPALEVIAIGPLGHIYIAHPLDSARLDAIAERLVNMAHVPAVFRAEPDNRAIAWTARGRFKLPDEIAAVVGIDHPFLSELGADLVKLCHHQAAGNLVISGWAIGCGKSLTFVEENGAHGGPGPAETEAFVLVPPATQLNVPKRGFLRPEDFRQAAQRTVGTQG